MDIAKSQSSLFPRVMAIVLMWVALIAAAEIPPDYYFPDPTISTNGVVRAVLFYEGKLYVGGNFTKVTDKTGTYSRTDLAAWDAATGFVTDFKANTNSGMVRAIAAGAGKVFVGGTFTKINNVSRSKVAALDPTSGEVAAGFRNNSATIDGEVWALAISDNYLYIGGSFTAVDGYARRDLASVEKNDGALNLLFDPEPTDSLNDSGKTPSGIYALMIHPHNPQIIFAGGNFLNIAGSSKSSFCAALRSDGMMAAQFQPAISQPIKAFDAHDSTLYVAMGGSTNRIAAYDMGKTPYGRNWRSMRVQGDAQAVAYSEQGYVFFGFHDGCFDTSDDYRMAAVDAKTGVIWEAYPHMNSFFGVWTLDAADSLLAVGGEFTQMNGRAQRYLAVFKLPSIGTVKPETPQLLKPLDNDLADFDKPQLFWNFAARAVTYDLQLATSDSTIQAFDVTDLSYRCGKLKSGMSYWWKVRASNAAGKSDWSPVWKFSTVPGDSDVPILVNPVDGANNMPLAFDFSWKPLRTAISYAIQVSDTEDFSRTIIGQSGITDTNFHISGLANKVHYYWRMCALTVSGDGPLVYASFLTNIAAPKTPRCISPKNNATQIPCRSMMYWSRCWDAVEYRIQVSTDRSFEKTIYDSSRMIDTSILATGLTEDTWYFWRVSAANAGGEVWSSPMQFMTVFPIPFMPRPILPAAGYIAKVDTLHLVWNQSSPHVTRYCIEIARDSSMRNAIIDSTILDTQVVKKCLENKADYWWRVRACNEIGWSAGSEKRLFKTAFPALPEIKFSLDRFAFSSKYGSIVYTVANKCDVSVQLFDSRGKTVWKIIRNEKAPGSYRENIPASALPVGAYFLSFKAGSFIKTADATLIR